MDEKPTIPPEVNDKPLEGVTGIQTLAVSDTKNNHQIQGDKAPQSKGEDEADTRDVTSEPEPASERQLQSPGEDFTVFNVRQKRLVVFTASLASVFSPMATSIYCKSQLYNKLSLMLPTN
jgi:hypothetical protein